MDLRILTAPSGSTKFAQLNRVPWCVHIRINFAKTDEQLKEGLERT